MNTAPNDVTNARSSRSQWLRRLRKDAPFFLIAIVVIVLDQVTKELVRSNLALGESWPNDDWLVRVTYVTNSGAAFGILQGQAIFLIFTTILGFAAIFFYFVYSPVMDGTLRAVLGLQLGGAAGNFIDRLRLGEVTDFIAFPLWPKFNVADTCITIGVIGLILFFLFRGSALDEGRSR